MEEKNKKKNFSLIIILILVAIIGVETYFIFSRNFKDKVNDEVPNDQTVKETVDDDNQIPDENQEKTNTDSSRENYVPKHKHDQNMPTYIIDVDTSKYTNIFNYIADQDELSMVLVYSASSGMDMGDKNYIPTAEETNILLSELKSSKAYISPNGYGGACSGGVLIRYVRNGTKHFIQTYPTIDSGGASSFSTDDGNIYKIIDENLKPEDIRIYEQNPNILYNGEEFYMLENLGSTLNSKIKSLGGIC